MPNQTLHPAPFKDKDNIYQQHAVAQAEESERATFITKTYAHLFGAIVALVVLEVLLFQAGIPERIAGYLMATQYGWLAALGGFMVVGTLGSSMAHRAKSLGSQYAGLGIFIVAEALILAPLLYFANYYSGAEIIANAAGVTLVGFAGLTAIAFNSRRDFTGMGPYVKWGLFAALGMIVASFIFGFTLGILFSGLMIVLAGAYILFQTSKIMRTYPTTHYVAASLELFAAVALMFMYVLRLLMALRD